MKLTLVAVGKVKEKYYNEAVDEYRKRLSRFATTEIVEFDEQPNTTLDKQAEKILPRLNGYVVALDKFGVNYDSEGLAEKIESVKQNYSQITFVIGSSDGLADSVKNKADLKLSFGAITLPHSLARVVLFEQLYRAFMINSNGKYHK